MKIKVTAKDSDFYKRELEVVNETKTVFQVKCGFTFIKPRCKVVKRFVVKPYGFGYGLLVDKKSGKDFLLDEPTKKCAVKWLQELGITADKREIKIKK